MELRSRLIVKITMPLYRTLLDPPAPRALSTMRKTVGCSSRLAPPGNGRQERQEYGREKGRVLNFFIRKCKFSFFSGSFVRDTRSHTCIYRHSCCFCTFLVEVKIVCMLLPFSVKRHLASLFVLWAKQACPRDAQRVKTKTGRAGKRAALKSKTKG